MVKKEAEHKKKFVTVTQIASSIGREESQRKTLIGLGLNKIGRSRTLIETSDVMGMVTKVKHLLKVEHS
jgi:large subunit ribosomal protein L30